MNSRNLSKKEIFENLPVPRAVAAMAIPTIISQLINLVYNLADSIFIGMTGDPNKTAAVTVVFTVFMMTVAFSNLFGIGGGSLMARMIGAGREEDAKKVCAYSFYGAIAVAILYSGLVFVLLDPILYLFGAKTETYADARIYVLLVVVCGNVPVILSQTVAHLLRNAGYSRQASIGLSGGGILNIILDPLFMFVLLPKGNEVFGAALATLLSNVGACIYLVIVLGRCSCRAPLSMSLKKAAKLQRHEQKELYSVGVPSGMLTALFDVGNIFLNALMSAHGNIELAAIGIVMKAERLPNAINIGLCQGMLPIVAYNYASGDHERMHKVISSVRVYGLVIAAACLVLFEIFAKQIVGLFMNTEVGSGKEAAACIALATVFLQIRCCASIFQFLNYHTSFCMQAVGDGKDTLLHATVRELVFYVPFMFLLDWLLGKFGLACALIAGEACGAVLAIVLFRRWKKKNNSLQKV